MSLLGVFLLVLAGLLVLFGLVALGFFLQPRPFRPHPAPTVSGLPTAILQGLPEPVRKHFSQSVGETPPRIASAVVWGRGKLCLRGVWVPMRYKAWYLPGEAFKRRIEVTWYRRPVLRGLDVFHGGICRYSLGGRTEQGPSTDVSCLLTLWTEMVWLPSVLVHDPRIRWHPVDQHSARLELPGLPHYEPVSLLVHFDPSTGRMTHLSADRPVDEPPGAFEPWRVDLLAWRSIQGMEIPCEIAIAEGEAGSPVSYWTVDGIAYNVHVTDQFKEISG